MILTIISLIKDVTDWISMLWLVFNGVIFIIALVRFLSERRKKKAAARAARAARPAAPVYGAAPGGNGFRNQAAHNAGFANARGYAMAAPQIMVPDQQVMAAHAAAHEQAVAAHMIAHEQGVEMHNAAMNMSNDAFMHTACHDSFLTDHGFTPVAEAPLMSGGFMMNGMM